MENRILWKARDLMLIHGVKHVTMDDLATQLGISKKTIYQFYKDKDNLVKAVVEVALEEHVYKHTKAQKEAENSVHEIFLMLEEMQAMFKSMNPLAMSELAKYYPEAFLKIEQFKNEFMLSIIKTNLIKGIEQGVYRNNIDIEILSKYRLATLFVPFDTHVFPQNKFDIGNVNFQIIENFIYGVMTTEGVRLMEQYKQEKIKASI
ncbi:MAG: TetR/AcrR family transcriptional regulator [Chitinophagia bacterium]|jgi:AcrR family transcriptional regulator|nr:TetR/AcrR family transcriptional regulator [Chitinophagia bacterium]